MRWLPLGALRIPAAGDALPAMVPLARRGYYLHHLAEVLGAPACCVHSPHMVKGQVQRSRQPLLYSAAAMGSWTGPLNVVASALAGAEVRGDALLTSVELTSEGFLCCREAYDLRALISLLDRRCGSAGSFVASRLGRPLIGCREKIPRAEAWPAGKLVGGALHHTPKTLLTELQPV